VKGEKERGEGGNGNIRGKDDQSKLYAYMKT
jgi:hypothetical protein